ncbi:MAG: mechanosensitive ion channel domain-containing protein [bacterium]
MEEPLQKLLEQVMLFIPRASMCLFIFLLFWSATAVFTKIVRRICQRSHFRKDILVLMERTARIVLLTFGAITALGTAGVNVSALVTGLGLTGFAIGFAFKDILSNLLAGILIIIFAPFQLNDHIFVAGFEGIVAQIDLRYTTLRAEGKKVLIPNSTLFTNAITVIGT